MRASLVCLSVLVFSHCSRVDHGRYSSAKVYDAPMFELL
jgi:hypothetical protein